MSKIVSYDSKLVGHGSKLVGFGNSIRPGNQVLEKSLGKFR